MAKTQPLRQELEKLGYGVQWQGSGRPIRVTKDGQTWDIPVAEYEVKGGRAYVAPETLSRITASAPKSDAQEQDLVHIRPYFEQKGYAVEWEPESKRVAVTHPVTGETHYAAPEVLREGKAYFKPATLAAIEERLTPAYEKTYSELTTEYGQLMGQLQDHINQYMNAMNNYMQQYSDHAVAMLAAYQQQYAQALDRLNALIGSQTEVPESVKAAFKILHEQTNENVRRLREEMNRRGILQSGIAADIEAKLREGELTEQEKILANWLDRRHKEIFTAAMEAARMQAQYAGGYAKAYEQAYLEPLRSYMDYAGKVYGLQSGLARTAYDLASRLRMWRAEQEESARKARLTAEAARQRYLLNLYKALEDAKYRQAALQSLDAYRQAMIEYHQAALQSLDAYRQAAAAASAKQHYGNPEAEEAYIADILAQPDADAAINYILRYKNDILASGARVSKLFDAIRKRWPSIDVASLEKFAYAFLKLKGALEDALELEDDLEEDLEE